MKTIENYIKQRFKLLRKHLIHFSKTNDKESLHQFRVEFKRINTISHLTGFCDQEFKAQKEIQKFKKLLKLSGKIRDADILQDLLTVQNISTTVKHRELQKTDRSKKQFCALHQKYKHRFKSLKKKLIKHSDTTNIRCIKEYIRKTQTDILTNCNLQTTKTALHTIRKKVKELKYIAEIQPGILNKELLISCNHLQELIGNWHDNILLVEYLKKKQPNFKKSIHRLQLNNKNYLSDIDKSIIEYKSI